MGRDGDSRGGRRRSVAREVVGEVGDVDALAAALGIEPFRVDRAAVGWTPRPTGPTSRPDETLVRADTKRASDQSHRADPNEDPNEDPNASGRRVAVPLGPSFVDGGAMVRTIRTRGGILVRRRFGSTRDAALARAKGIFDRVVVYDASDFVGRIGRVGEDGSRAVQHCPTAPAFASRRATRS